MGIAQLINRGKMGYPLFFKAGDDFVQMRTKPLITRDEIPDNPAPCL